MTWTVLLPCPHFRAASAYRPSQPHAHVFGPLLSTQGPAVWRPLFARLPPPTRTPPEVQCNMVGPARRMTLCKALPVSFLAAGPAPPIPLSFQGLNSNTTLRNLDLGANDIGDDGCCALAECLGINIVLTSLALCRNSISYSGCSALAAVLDRNQTLTALDLANNAFGDDGCCVLARSLNANTTLQSLILAANELTEVGCAALAEVVPLTSRDTAHVSTDVASGDGTEARGSGGDWRWKHELYALIPSNWHSIVSQWILQKRSPKFLQIRSEFQFERIGASSHLHPDCKDTPSRSSFHSGIGVTYWVSFKSIRPPQQVP